jgi:GTP-binding protein
MKSRIKELHTFEGLVVKSSRSNCWRYLCIIGVEGFEIGDTIADFENPEALKQLLLMSQQ